MTPMPIFVPDERPLEVCAACDGVSEGLAGPVALEMALLVDVANVVDVLDIEEVSALLASWTMVK